MRITYLGQTVVLHQVIEGLVGNGEVTCVESVLVHGA